MDLSEGVPGGHSFGGGIGVYAFGGGLRAKLTVRGAWIVGETCIRRGGRREGLAGIRDKHMG